MKQTAKATLVYGIQEVQNLLAGRLEALDHVYFDSSKRTLPLFNLMKICRRERLAYNLVPPMKLEQLAGKADHQGVVALCSAKPYATAEEVGQLIAGKPLPLLVVAASIEDPQNLGAIVRACLAFGADALFLERKNTAPLSEAVVRASAGAVEHLCIARPKNLEGIIRGYRDKGFSVIGTDALKGNPPSAVNLKVPAVVILGGEHRGIPPYLEKCCTSFISIPMDGRAHSLNVAAACAVMLYECARQRGPS